MLCVLACKLIFWLVSANSLETKIIPRLVLATERQFWQVLACRAPDIFLVSSFASWSPSTHPSLPSYVISVSLGNALCREGCFTNIDISCCRHVLIRPRRGLGFL